MFTISENKWIKKISEYLIYLFLFTFPFLNYTSFLYFGSSTRSINLIAISSTLAVLGGIYLFQKGSKISFFRLSLTISLFLYFCFMCISALRGGNFETAFYSNITRMTGLWYLLCLSVLVSFLVAIFNCAEKRKRLLMGIVLSGALFSILSLLGPEGLNLIFKGYKGDGFTFGNSTFAGMYLFGGFIFSLYLYFVSTNKKWLFLITSFVFVFNPFILNISKSEGKGVLSFLGEARASATALFMALALFFVAFLISKIKNFNFKKKLSYMLFLLSFLVMAIGAFSLFSQDGILRKFYLSQSTSARLLVWEMSDKLIAEKPFLGRGIESFEKTFELNYDNRALESKFGAEPWFDRAHNIFIDETFANGFIGLGLYIVIYIILGWSLLFVIFKAKNRDNVVLAVFLLVYSLLHLIELQTSFDTSISYIILAVVIALAISVIKETKEEGGAILLKEVKHSTKYVIATLLIVFGGWSLFYGVIPFVSSGIVNGQIRQVGSAEKRLAFYDTLFATPVDLQAILWRTITDFQRGISQNPKVLEDPKKVSFLIKELGRFETEYTSYIESNPKNFRALLNYADTKIYFMLFGINKLDEAQNILDRAIDLVPQAPQPYWMKAVAYLYMQKFDLARQWAKKAYDLNPNIQGSQEVIKYIEDSIKTFPEIDLFFFKQI